MKKLGAALLAMLISASLAVAAAQEITMVSGEEDREWLYFTFWEGIEFYQYGDGEASPPPSGLEAMYRWMEMSGATEEMAFLRMPSGRALASICRTEMGEALSAEALCSLWPQMAKSLEKSVQYLNGDPLCARVVDWEGREWMHVQTMLVLDGEKMLSIELEGYANCDDGVMVEIWLASPSRPTYLYDAAANAELTADLDVARAWLGSIRLPAATAGAQSAPPAPAPGESAAQPIPPSETLVTYQDPDGQFSLSVPENMIIITPDQVRARMVTAQQDVPDSGKLPLYRYWLKEAETYQATLFTEPTYGTALLIMFSEAERLRTLDDIEALAPMIETAFSRNLTGSLTIPQPQRVQLAGEDATSFLFEGSYLGKNATVLVIASLHGGVVHEVNLWSVPEDSQADWADAILRILDSLRYGEAAK